jgi:hypothetical protein
VLKPISNKAQMNTTIKIGEARQLICLDIIYFSMTHTLDSIKVIVSKRGKEEHSEVLRDRSNSSWLNSRFKTEKLSKGSYNVEISVPKGATIGGVTDCNFSKC